MTSTNLHRLDFNLLLDLDALLREGSVVGAARTRHLSPPAMSRRLTRLRESLGDPLFVPAGRGLVPTPRALALRERVQRAISEVGRVFTADALDLENLQRNFVIRANDGFLGSWAMRLATAMRAEAPGVSLQFIARADKSSEPLRSGAIDLAIGAPGPAEPDLHQAALFSAPFVGVVRAGHPLARAGKSRAISLKDFVKWPHISASRRGDAASRIDDALVQLGSTRRIAVAAPGFQAALAMAASSDCITAVPEPFARWATAQPPLHVFKLPFPLPDVEVCQVWHHRHHLDPAHQWLRAKVLEGCADGGI